MSGRVRITVELTPEQAAALKTICERTDYQRALELLNLSVIRSIRSRQVDQIFGALGAVETALTGVHVSTIPWIDSGRVL